MFFIFTVLFPTTKSSLRRGQIQNMGIKPYTEKMTRTRAERLAKLFPQYNSEVVMAFAESVSFYGDHGLTVRS